MPSMSEIIVLFYLSLLAWFFFWLSPRVNDGRIEKMIEKHLNELEQKNKMNKKEDVENE